MDQPGGSSPTDEAVPVNKEGVSMGQEGNLVNEVQKHTEDVELLVNLLTSAASLVQAVDEAQKAAQLAHHCTEDALNQASEATELARTVFYASRQLGERMLIQGKQSGYKELFKKHPELNLGFETFQRLLMETEDVLSHSKRKWNVARVGIDPHSTGRGHGHNDEYKLHFNGHTSCEKTLSHHKQLETLRNEEHMGGAYLTHRRRSPRRSPSSGTDGLSPLLSEEELITIKPITHSPSRQSSTRFTNKIVHRDKTHDSSDSEPEEVSRSLP